MEVLSLGHYLETATDYLDDYRDVEKVKKLYAKDPKKFEEMWQGLFKDTKSYMVKSFIRLLNEKGLYIQYERYASRYNPEEGISQDLRIYQFSKDIGQVATLKVTEHEPFGAYRRKARF